MNDETLTMTGYEWWRYRAAIEAEARRAALDEAIGTAADVRFAFAAYPGDGADGDGPLGLLMAAVIDALTRLRDGASPDSPEVR